MKTPDYAKINVKDANEFLEAANGSFEVALLAVILHCSKSIESSVRIDNNSATRGYIFDIASCLDDVNKSLISILNEIKDEKEI